MTHQDTHWSGYLPQKAVLMGVRRPQSQPQASSSAPSTLLKIDLVFVGTLSNPAESTLLEKMVQAMGGTRESYRVVESMDELGAYELRAVVQLGGTLEFSEWQGKPFLITHSLSELLNNPTAKKAAWASLQKMMEHLKWK